jgi:deazaflavin-dependent oxidoreductase (nitroreductase family)
MTPLTKLLNPLVAALAGRRHFPMAAQIHHVGRRSGKPYVTSVGARLHDGIVLIPLTFGTRSDWARNVYAAGECSVRINGTDYHAVAPQFIAFSEAAPMLRPLFRAAERLFFKLLGIQQFMRLQLAAR